MTAKRSTRKKLTPVQIAARHADAWLDGLLEDSTACGSPNYGVDFDNDVAVSDVLKAINQGRPDPLDPMAPATNNTQDDWRMLERHAGYLFGVQIGLRLRAAGQGGTR